MDMILRGYRKLNFMNDNNETIAGTSIWLSWALEETENSSGEESAKYFISDGGAIPLPKLQIGGSYSGNFNHKGKLISLAETSGFGRSDKFPKA